MTNPTADEKLDDVLQSELSAHYGEDGASYADYGQLRTKLAELLEAQFQRGEKAGEAKGRREELNWVLATWPHEGIVRARLAELDSEKPQGDTIDPISAARAEGYKWGRREELERLLSLKSVPTLAEGFGARAIAKEAIERRLAELDSAEKPKG
jgi:hypothetical protein